MSKLLPHHADVLKALRKIREECGEDYSFASFNLIAIYSRTKDKATVRRTVRHLARKGLTRYEKGLFTEDGELAGSGYAITEAGLAALEAA